MAESTGDAALDFDVVAAAIRADAADLRSFMDAFAVKLADALPGQVTVEREGGLFQKEHRVRRIAVDLDDRHYELVRAGSSVDARTAHKVRGITLKTEDVPLQDWIDSLARHLTAHAERSASARAALNRLLT